MQWAVLLPVVLTLIATSDSVADNSFFSNIANVCYAKWALEAFVISNAKRFYAPHSFSLPFLCLINYLSNIDFCADINFANLV